MTPPEGDRQRAFEYAMKWFEIHAGQRLQLMEFYFVATGLLGAGFITAFQLQYDYVAYALSAMLIALSLCFWQLDRRTSQLVKIAEAYLKEVGDELSKSVGTQTINLAEAAEHHPLILSYTKVFRIVFVIVGLAAAAGVFLVAFADAPVSGASNPSVATP